MHAWVLLGLVCVFVLRSRRNEHGCKFTASADVSKIWIMRYEGFLVALHALLCFLFSLIRFFECFGSICFSYVLQGDWHANLPVQIMIQVGFLIDGVQYIPSDHVWSSRSITNNPSAYGTEVPDERFPVTVLNPFCMDGAHFNLINHFFFYCSCCYHTTLLYIDLHTLAVHDFLFLLFILYVTFCRKSIFQMRIGASLSSHPYLDEMFTATATKTPE
jgi:hypothetical protein